VKFTAEEHQVLRVLGKTVILRKPSNAVMPDYVAATVVKYDPEKGLADLCTAGQHYNLSAVPYSKELDKEGSWCFREDLSLMAPESEKQAPPPPKKPRKSPKVASEAEASSPP
jgi:hypothetical protein